MGRGDEFDVFSTLVTQFQEDFGEALSGDRQTGKFGADDMVLAETASEATAGEEDGTCAIFAGDAGFFPEVEGGFGGDDVVACAAEAGGRGTVSGAMAWAEGTGGIWVEIHSKSPLFDYNVIISQFPILCKLRQLDHQAASA